MNWEQYYIGYEAYVKGYMFNEHQSVSWQNGWRAAANLASYYS